MNNTALHDKHVELTDGNYRTSTKLWNFPNQGINHAMCVCVCQYELMY